MNKTSETSETNTKEKYIGKPAKKSAQIYKTKIISKKKEETNNSRKREDMD